MISFKQPDFIDSPPCSRIILGKTPCGTTIFYTNNLYKLVVPQEYRTMSYKRVVTRNGKSYGPYFYESYRGEDGKVKKRYLGKLEEKKSASKFSVFAFSILGVLFLL